MSKLIIALVTLVGLVSCAQGPRYAVNAKRYSKMQAGEGEVKVSLWDQQAWLLNRDGAVVLKTDVSTGTTGHATPAQEYHVIDKAEHKRSNLYGRYLDKKSGRVTQPKAWLHKGPVPENWRWEGIEMPYWMRLSHDGIGMHVGAFPRRKKCSFGCIRVHEAAQPLIYEKMPVGGKLTVVKRSLISEMDTAEDFSKWQRMQWGE